MVPRHSCTLDVSLLHNCRATALGAAAAAAEARPHASTSTSSKYPGTSSSSCGLVGRSSSCAAPGRRTRPSAGGWYSSTRRKPAGEWEEHEPGEGQGWRLALVRQAEACVCGGLSAHSGWCRSRAGYAGLAGCALCLASYPPRAGAWQRAAAARRARARRTREDAVPRVERAHPRHHVPGHRHLRVRRCGHDDEAELGRGAAGAASVLPPPPPPPLPPRLLPPLPNRTASRRAASGRLLQHQGPPTRRPLQPCTSGWTRGRAAAAAACSSRPRNPEQAQASRPPHVELAVAQAKALVRHGVRILRPQRGQPQHRLVLPGWGSTEQGAGRHQR